MGLFLWALCVSCPTKETSWDC